MAAPEHYDASALQSVRPVSCKSALARSHSSSPWHSGDNALIYNQMVVQVSTEEEVDRIFQALADTTRRDILTRAIQNEQSVSALARHYDMSFAAVQKHVAVLERAELVVKERHGREQIVHGNVATLREAAALLADYEQLWIHRAEQIASILAGRKGNTR